MQAEIKHFSSMGTRVILAFVLSIMLIPAGAFTAFGTQSTEESSSSAVAAQDEESSSTASAQAEEETSSPSGAASTTSAATVTTSSASDADASTTSAQTSASASSAAASSSSGASTSSSAKNEAAAQSEEHEASPQDTGGYGVDLDNSQIGGIHPVNSGTCTGPVAVSETANTSGALNFKFPAGTTDAKIVITMPNGVQWVNPGGTNGVATVSELEGTTATYGGAGSGSYGGHYTYTVNANTTEFTLTNLLIKQHTFYAGRVANTPITVDTYYGGGTTPKDHVEFTSVDLQTLGICDSQMNPTSIYFASLDGTLPFGYVGDAAATGNFVPLVHVGSAHNDGALMDKIIVTVTPTAITGTGDKTKGILHNDNPNWTMTGPDANGVYTFEMDNVFGVAYNAMTPQFHMEFPDTYFDLNDVITYNMAVSGVYVDGLPITTTADSSKDITVKLVDKEVKWSVGVKSLNEMINLGLINQAVVNTNEGETRYSQFGTHDVSSGLIGNFYYGNYSGKDSDPTRAVFDFDTEVIGVRSVVLPVPYKDADGDGLNDITMTNVIYTTNLDSTPRTYASPIDTDSSNRVALGPVALGLADGEYVKTFSVDYSMIPGVTALGYNGGGPADAGMFGVVLKDGAHSESTVSLVDIASESVNITNKIVSNTSDERGALNIFQPGTVSKTAGTSGKFEFGLRPDYWSVGSTPTPVTFIRNPMGLDFDLNSIRVYNDAGGVRTDIPLADCKVSTFNDSAGVQVIRVELPESGVGAINANEAEYRANWWNVTINYHVPALSPGGTWGWDEILFMEDNVASHTNKASSATALAQELKDDNAGYILQASASTSFNIEGRTDMVIDNAIKYTDAADSAYTAFSKDGAHLILDAPTSVDLKMSIYNNTGTAGVVSGGSAIYMPIPKTGDNWGSMMNASYPAFQFSTELTGEIPNPEPTRYTILYGSVTPSDSKTALESYAFEAWNAANAASYNCVKVVQNTDWAYSATDFTRNFVMTLKLSANDTLADDQFDVWAPAYNERYTGNAGTYELWKNGEYSALVTALGQIMGNVWLDENLDGVQQASETALPAADKAGWDVKVYEKADYDTNGFGATTVGSAVTDASGGYFIDKLDRSTEYVLTASKAGVDYWFTTPVTASYGKSNNSFVGSTVADGGASGAAAATADKAARKVADSAVNTNGLGIYPIGVREAQAKGASTPEDVSGATGKMGSTITYTIGYANTTTSAGNVVIKDATPEHTTFVSATQNPGTAPAVGATGNLEWIIATDPGDSGSVTFTVKVDSDMTTATDIENTATVKVGNNPEVTTNTTKTNVPVAPKATLAVPTVNKMFSSTSASRPEAKTFSFDLNGKNGTEPMPEGTAVGGTATKTTTDAGTAEAFGNITFNAPGTYVYTITEQVPGTVPAGYTYDASEYTWTVTVTGSSTLTATGELVKTVDDAPKARGAAAGGGTTPVDSADFTNKYIVTPTTWTPPTVTKTVTGSVPAGTDETFTFKLTGTGIAAAGVTKTVTGAGSVSFDAINYTTAGTYTYQITEVAGSNAGYTYDKSVYDISVVVTDTSGTLNAVPTVTKTTVKSGDELTYTLVVSNSGTADAVGIWVKDIVPANTTFISAESAVNTENGAVNWFVDKLAPGAMSTLSFKVRVNDNLGSDVNILNTVQYENTDNPVPPTDYSKTPSGGESNKVGTVVNPTTPPTTSSTATTSTATTTTSTTATATTAAATPARTATAATAAKTGDLPLVPIALGIAALCAAAVIALSRKHVKR